MDFSYGGNNFFCWSAIAFNLDYVRVYWKNI